MVVVRDKKPDVTVGAISGTTVPAADSTPSVTPPVNADLLSTEEVQNIVSSYPEVFTDEPPFGGSQIELDVEMIPYRMSQKF
jgi:hypothetical protein